MLWAYEKETLGYYLTGHPLQQYSNELERLGQVKAHELTEEVLGKEITIGGVITGVKLLRTRKGDQMATFVLEDLTGTVETLVWPKTYERYRSLLESDAPVLVKGRCEGDAKGQLRLLCSEMKPLETLWGNAVQKASITIPIPSLDEEKAEQLESLLQRHPGGCPVHFELVNNQAYRIRLIPRDELAINPIPAFISEVEHLFGESSVKLYT